MRTKSISRRLFLGTAIAGSALMLASTLLAQPSGHRGRGGPGGPGMLLRELDLSESQREQIHSLFQEAEATGTRERVREAREALHDAVESGAADEATLQQLGFALGEAEGQAAIERARIHSRVQESLTPEQREQLRTLREEHEEKMRERRERFEQRRQRRDGNQGQRPAVL